MKINNIALIISTILFIGVSTPAYAQEATDNPTYIVQPGENLTEIAQKFNVSINDIINVNNINNSDLIIPGMELLIPGLEGISGVLTSNFINIGESLSSITRKYGVDVELFTKLNPITCPNELYIGSSIILPEIKESSNKVISLSVNDSKSILDYAIIFESNPWVLNLSNNLFSNYIAVPGETFFIQAKDDLSAPSQISKYISSIELYPLPLVQGHTVNLKVKTTTPGILNGKIGTRELFFVLDGTENNYVAIQGIHAMTNPGLIPMQVTGVFENNEKYSLEQMVLVKSGGYSKEEITVEQTTIDQEIIETEDSQIQSILAQRTQDKYWSVPFRFPVDGSLTDNTIGFSSKFGNRRSYNSGQLNSFHGGLDFSVVLNSLNIYAPAPGRILFTGLMNIRGNTTFIDHGYGIVSGYGHQAEILVTPGEMVEAGQIIGIIGKTGRVTGPHLHWEIWVNGVQVDPLDWINTTYP